MKEFIKGFHPDPRRIFSTKFDLAGNIQTVSFLDTGDRTHPVEKFDYRALLSKETLDKLKELDK